MAEVAYIPGEPGHERRPALGYVMVITAFKDQSELYDRSQGRSPIGDLATRADSGSTTGAFLGFALVLVLTRRKTLRLTRREPLPRRLRDRRCRLRAVALFRRDRQASIGIALLLEFLGPILIAIWAWGSSRSRSAAGCGWRSCSRSPGSRSSSRSERSLAGRARRGRGSHRRGRLCRLRADGRARGQLARSGVVERVRLPLRGTLLGRRPAGLALPCRPARRQRPLLGHLERHALPVWLLLLYVVVAGTMITFLLVATALRHISATRVGIIAMLEPVAASVVAFLWLGESFGTAQLIGGSVVLAAILIAQTAR